MKVRNNHGFVRREKSCVPADAGERKEPGEGRHQACKGSKVVVGRRMALVVEERGVLSRRNG